MLLQYKINSASVGVSMLLQYKINSASTDAFMPLIK